MEVKDLAHIDHSPLLRQLFDTAKDWMENVARSQGRENEERILHILPKTIGRNGGFIVNVLSANQLVNTTFYAKVQAVSMDTVLMHHVLKNVKCGPDAFFIPVLQLQELSDNLYHGVVTENVPNWSMARALTKAEMNEFFGERDRLLSTTFLLNVLIELGRFGNIPNNGANWGFIDIVDYPVSYPDISIVDFSKATYRTDRRFQNEKTFLKCWRECLHNVIDRWQTGWSPTDADLIALYSPLRREEAIAEQAELLPFLQSSEAFTDVLQSACDETALWLHETIQRARYNVLLPDVSIKITANAGTAADDESILIPFRYVPRPNTDGLAIPYQVAVTEYVQMVAEWNVSIRSLYQWFPFPVDASGDSRDSGRYDLYCVSTEGTACEGDVGEETEWNEQFAEYAGASINDVTVSDVGLLDDLLSPYTSMVTELHPRDVTIYSSEYIVIKGPAPYYEERIGSSYKTRNYRDRTLSMEENLCPGDVGEDTERNAKYVTNTVDGVGMAHMDGNELRAEDVLVFDASEGQLQSIPSASFFLRLNPNK